MPRDSSGNYTLTAGNPVVTGTTIDASWANALTADLVTVLTDSLSRSGDGGMLMAFQFADGTVSAPGQTWTSETSSGFYRAGTNDVRYSIAGVDRIQIRANSTEPFRIWNATSGAWKLPLNEGGAYTITAAWTFDAGVTFTTGNIVAGTVDADFGAVTATSYGGITEANLVDKSATETISGAWTLPEASITAHEAALTILESQITDGSILARVASAETITGVWTLDAAVTTAGYGTGGRVKDGGDTAQPIGFNVMPVYEVDGNDTVDLAHNGMYWHKDAGSASAITLDDDSDIPQGATIVICNEDSNDITITEGAGVTIKYMDGAGSAPPEGNLTLTRAGVATIYKYSDTVYHVWGNGLS